jgi:signal peptide peptidase SppA
MRFAHLIEQVYFQPWYITPQAHAVIHRLLQAHLTTKAGDLGLGDLVNQRRPLSIDAAGFATIHILGPLGKNLSNLEKACGCTSFEDIRADLEQAIALRARGILLDVDSPGGTVQGTPETAAALAAAPLPVVAYSENTMASCAYYLAASAKAIVASPSAWIGSIGVFIPWVDYAEQFAALGLKPDPIVNEGGDLKTVGFTGRLNATEREYLQAVVDDHFAQFRDHVLAYRAVPATAMRGQCFAGYNALGANLVDLIGEKAAAYAELQRLAD